ncbi:hypothetical protein [Streptomyces griseosporeus]|uniref:hypothetical protein n=1 Tax=Streptomyces griseosporeus TaxID=1910 RepID=UPI0036FFCB45
MSRKPFTVRQTVLCGGAAAAGTAAGTVAETLAHHVPSSGPLATAVVALWVLEKLNALIDDTQA